MISVNQVSQTGSRPGDSEWLSRLPAWFVEACLPEDTEYVEEELPEDLPPEERKARVLARKWKLTWWTSWMAPAEREWMWWSADMRDANIIRIEIDRLGDPQPGDRPGFWWLFSTAGATSFIDHLGR